jgi:hypothetical protein
MKEIETSCIKRVGGDEQNGTSISPDCNGNPVIAIPKS